MDRQTFWQTIEHARRATPGAPAREIAEALIRDVASLPPEEIVSFQGWLDAYRYAANRRELWAVAAYIAGGCSDDGFDYFRGWLVAQGEAVYLAAMKDPSSLVDHHWFGDDERWPEMRCELMCYVGLKAFERATGKQMELPDDVPEIAERSTWPADRIAGYDWSNDEIVKLFPRLVTRWTFESR